MNLLPYYNCLLCFDRCVFPSNGQFSSSCSDSVVKDAALLDLKVGQVGSLKPEYCIMELNTWMS